LTEVDSDNEWAGVGERIRITRETRGISLRELARRVDVSASHISHVERGMAAFSVRSLYNVVSVLGVSMDSLFEDIDTPEGFSMWDRPDEAEVATQGGPLDEAGIVLRRGSRPSLKLQSGPRWERLTAKPEEGCEFLEVIYAPDPGAEPPEDYIRHSGREYGVILSGVLNVQIGFSEAQLGAGDSLAFDSRIPHRFWNSGPDEVRAVWFVADHVETAEGETHNAAAAEHRSGHDF
jgi:transcriptional regulator with XRE-family HTH domain